MTSFFACAGPSASTHKIHSIGIQQFFFYSVYLSFFSHTTQRYQSQIAIISYHGYFLIDNSRDRHIHVILDWWNCCCIDDSQFLVHVHVLNDCNRPFVLVELNSLRDPMIEAEEEEDSWNNRLKFANLHCQIFVVLEVDEFVHVDFPSKQNPIFSSAKFSYKINNTWECCCVVLCRPRVFVV